MVPHEIIVGGGFGGLSATRSLRNTQVRVTLIDKRNRHPAAFGRAVLSRRLSGIGDKGDLAIVGRTYAVADLRFATFAGFSAWVLWAVVHTYFLIEFANSLFVLLEWGPCCPGKTSASASLVRGTSFGTELD